ncbi:MAG: SUMF1/EgtB/PvdO family nonheme iron enzyme [Anaerolineae bacterium]|nr:SUMF1/EgtB/PvdO family nonheme iron enzyme [Anaerolineae bacterium]
MIENTKSGIHRDEEFVKIPSGEFIYGPEVCFERLEQCPPFKSRQTIDLPGFQIGRYPITNTQWRRFLGATGHNWIGSWYRYVSGWRGKFLRAYTPARNYPENHDNFPIVDVTQADAIAYCKWLSGEIDKPCGLPTEFQWEKAARGTDGRIYPWGDTAPRPEIQWQKKFPVTPDTYLFSLIFKPQREWARAGWYWRNGYPLAVGSFPENVSPYGCVDMSGNIWEWTVSLYNPDLPDFHTVKGGSWGYSIHHTALNVRSACSVTTKSVDYHAHGTGFRVIIEY